jgi:hypothetical protein
MPSLINRYILTNDKKTSPLEQQAIATLAELFPDCTIEKTQTIQALWSGYGEIARYSVLPNEPNTQHHSVIVKLVNPSDIKAHPRNWDGKASHDRKLSSYENEAIFYTDLSQFTHANCRVPSFIGGFTSTVNQTQSSAIVMQDLDACGYTYRTLNPDQGLIKKGIHWLAHFHAQFIQVPQLKNRQQVPKKLLNKLWPVGTYWHLATRQDEWQAMQESELKNNAHTIDSILNSASYQTLLHGDAKIANFCIQEDFSDLAAVDFQYVGSGVGVKDLIYFLGSCLNSDELYQQADDFIDEYFASLTNALTEQDSVGQTEMAKAVCSQWRSLLPFAWADFERFLLGWSPDHHKLTSYSAEQTRCALLKISQFNSL